MTVLLISRVGLPAIQKNGKAVSTGSLRGFGDGEAITGMTNPAVKSP